MHDRPPLFRGARHRPSTTIFSAQRQLRVFDLDHANCDEAQRNPVNIPRRSLPPTGTATHPRACDSGFAAVATSSASAHSNFAITGRLNTPLASSFCPVPNKPLQEPYPGPSAWTGSCVDVVAPGVVFDPEELSLLGSVFDQAIASLLSSMRTPAETMEITKIILERAVAGELDPIKLEFAALSNLIVTSVASAPAASSQDASGSSPSPNTSTG